MYINRKDTEKGRMKILVVFFYFIFCAFCVPLGKCFTHFLSQRRNSKSVRISLHFGFPIAYCLCDNGRQKNSENTGSIKFLTEVWSILHSIQDCSKKVLAIDVLLNLISTEKGAKPNPGRCGPVSDSRSKIPSADSIFLWGLVTLAVAYVPTSLVIK